METNWLRLEQDLKERGLALTQVKCKAELGTSLADVAARFHNLELELSRESVASDLRSAKQALKKHTALRQQVSVEAALVGDMARERSSSAELQGALDEYALKFERLQPLLAAKQCELEAAQVAQQLLFDIGEEHAWTEQSLAQLDVICTAQAPPQTLHDATVLSKKLAEMDRVLCSRRPVVENLLQQSVSTPIKFGAEVAEKSKRLEKRWSELVEMCEAQRVVVAHALTEQQDLDQLSQISLAVNEKKTIIQNAVLATSAKEAAIIDKHLAKLDQLEHELKAFKVSMFTLLIKRLRNLNYHSLVISSL